ncbi:hypothetical protein L596_007504 [Steinernema carpocapsae]|uniref:E3 ubiquitin-protein ligase n=1 Tax=Steinernema carpocapsae TaxID=34508 RepID=A0A4V6A614_STECR|nr:hypothetical protein L596_007504 [Steinernema carpocapsae]
MVDDARVFSPDGRDDCDICYQKAVYPTHLQCCRNCFCFLCIKGVFIRQGTCPLCRATLDASLFDRPSFNQQVGTEVPITDSMREEEEEEPQAPNVKEEPEAGDLDETPPPSPEPVTDGNVKHGIDEDEDNSPTQPLDSQADLPGSSAFPQASASQIRTDMKPSAEQLASLVDAPNSSDVKHTAAERNSLISAPSTSIEAPSTSNQALELPDVRSELPYIVTSDDSSNGPSPSRDAATTSPQSRNYVRSGVQWFYKGRRDGWWRYDPTSERHIERAYNDDGEGQYTAYISGYNYRICFADMTQIRVDATGAPSQCKRAIKRVLPEELHRFRRSVKGIAGIFFTRNDS